MRSSLFLKLADDDPKVMARLATSLVYTILFFHVVTRLPLIGLMPFQWEDVELIPFCTPWY